VLAILAPDRMSVLASRSLVCALDDEIAKMENVNAAMRDVRMGRVE